MPLGDIKERPEDVPEVKACFQLDFDPDGFLAQLPYHSIQQYKTNIELRRSSEEVAKLTAENIPEYIVVKDC